jgi:hypothetical protein
VGGIDFVGLDGMGIGEGENLIVEPCPAIGKRGYDALRKRFIATGDCAVVCVVENLRSPTRDPEERTGSEKILRLNGLEFDRMATEPYGRLDMSDSAIVIRRIVLILGPGTAVVIDEN